MNKVDKTLITFVHFHRERQKVYSENLSYFIEFGLVDSEKYHFNFIINSETQGVPIPKLKNLNIIKGSNSGHDFGAYKESLASIEIDNFNKFIFINDTCTGPFLPTYMPENITWIELLTSKLNDRVKMTGPTWNYDIYKHIQSFCFALDREGLEILLKNKKFDTDNKCKERIIRENEVGMSRVIIESGFDIKPLQLSQFSKETHRDVCWPNRYFGFNVNPIEVMFVKRSRYSKAFNFPEDPIIENYIKWNRMSRDNII
jgi:hypothetical protein